MLQNAYFLAKISVDTAENERHFAEILPKLATTLPAPPGAAARAAPAAAQGRRERRADRQPAALGRHADFCFFARVC